MKRIAIAVLAGGIAFGGVFGLAASLDVSSNSLGAASETVAACQTAQLTASYDTQYTSALPGYKVLTVTVGGLQSTCHDKAYKVTLTDGAGASLGEVSDSTPSSGTSFEATFAGNIAAEDVEGVHVVIAG